MNNLNIQLEKECITAETRSHPTLIKIIIKLNNINHEG